MHTQRHEPYEPADRPVRFYEIALCLVTQILMLVEQRTQSHLLEMAAASSLAVLLVLSLRKLLVPPRYSATRTVFVLVSIIGLFLLFMA